MISRTAKQFVISLDPSKSVTARDAHGLLVKIGIWKDTENLEKFRNHDNSGLIDLPHVDTKLLDSSMFKKDRDVSRRKKFDDLISFTLDDESTKDVDDAISIDPKPTPDGNYRIFVHISDVDRWIGPHSYLDIFARTRGTSIYFPGEVLPMFPHYLVRDMSIEPGQANEVLSFRVDVGPRGDIVSYDVCPGLISNVRKVSYNEADAILESTKTVSSQLNLHPNSVPFLLRRLVEVSSVLEKKRESQGSVEFVLPEPLPKVELMDENDARSAKIVGIQSDEVYDKSTSRRIIHELMVLCGQVAARYAIQHNIPSRFVHLPDFRKIPVKDHNGKIISVNELEPVVISQAMVEFMESVSVDTKCCMYQKHKMCYKKHFTRHVTHTTHTYNTTHIHYQPVLICKQ
eukprot:TRINITY_DN3392_c0_g1_i1.p1 TRINITY_DN3392_c0_g1~~TRINITY_DN3392_c0_g1_i1.p1  ORF type:complete len:401 (-),score=58.62 TRINITY_DN3392_c0_g1_i1:48-1250(-)